MADLALLNDFNALCTKAEGRDKLARAVQYTCRTMVGLSSLAAPTTGTRLSKLEAHSRTVMTQLASARRTHRWCKEFPVLQGLVKALSIKDPVDRVLEVLQKASLAVFMIIDHIGQLKQWKLLSGGKRAGSGTIQLGLKFFCLSNCIGAVSQMKKYFALSAAKEDKRSEMGKCLEACLKHFLIIFQTAHLSLMCQSHDALVGIAGVITSGMDLRAQWPARKPVAVAAPRPAPLELVGSKGKPSEEAKAA